MIYAFGSNGSGQLGLGHTKDLSIPESNTPHGCGGTFEVRQIAAGGNHTLIAHSNGRIDAHGSSEYNQCSQKDVPPRGADDIRLNLMLSGSSSGNGRGAQISATWTTSIYLNQTGEVATVGEGLGGELGLGKDVSKVSSLQTIPDFPPQQTAIAQLASCMAHTVAVLDDGEVYGWGKGGKGQLGEPAEDVWSPRKIEGIPFPAVKAVCGKDFTCIVGSREKGELVVLGFRSRDRFGLIASKPPAAPGWKDIAASWGSIFVLQQNGELTGFGRNDHGQLPPPDLPPIGSFAAGSEHCLAVTKAGKVLAWGWGEHGNCGEPTDADGDVKGRWNEIEIPRSQRATAVYAGCATSFIVTADDAEQNGQPG